MLVDDQVDVLFTYLSFLEGQGFNVESFTDPIVALRQFAQVSLKGILTNNVMQPTESTNLAAANNTSISYSSQNHN